MNSYKNKVSIIIRVKNEEKWINSCLRSVFNQIYKNFEVIIVNNQSNDNTIKNIKDFNVRVINIKNFYPGKAINYGIKKSKGQFIVCLSGHCIPKDKYWLSNLIKNLQNKKVAGVYGRQEPLSFSKPSDKRDLILTFGLDKKIQKKDYFFHNANSAFRKDVWEKFPFNEKITNIEDREWGKRVINAGFKIIYDPKASVFHYHGIHQNQKSDRAINVSNLMEKIDGDYKYKNKKLTSSKIFTMIPVNYNFEAKHYMALLNFTINETQKSKFSKNIFISTNKKLVFKKNESKFVKEIFTRPDFLQNEHTSIGDIIHNTLDKIENKYDQQDIVVVMDPSQPFRPDNIIDKMLTKLKMSKSDSIIAVYPEGRNIFNTMEKNQINIDESNFIPRHLKDNKLLVSLFGTCFITYAKFIRENSFFGRKIIPFIIDNSISNIQIRNEKDFENLKVIKKLI